MALNQVYNKGAKIMIVISQSQSMNTNDLKTELTYTNVFQNTLEMVHLLNDVTASQVEDFVTKMIRM